MKLGIASDHRGFQLKEKIKRHFTNTDIEIIDYGTNSEESTDYPDYAFKVSEAVRDKKVDFGVAICGSGIGISIACNKVKGIRCAKVDSIDDVIATRKDNDANVVAFSEKIPIEDAIEFVNTFIHTPCSLEEKHVRRRNKIKDYEEQL